MVYDWRLALIAIGLMVIYLITSLVLFPFMRQRQEDLIAKSAKEKTHVIETIRASRAVKLFSRETEWESAWRNLYADVINSGVSYGKLEISNQFASRLLFGLQTVLIIYFGARFILVEYLNVGMLFAFMAYRQNFSMCAEALVNKGIEFRMLGLHLDRLSDIVQADTEDGLELTASDIRRVCGKIDLEEISFIYAQNDPFVFQKLSLSIKLGEFVGVAGPSGGGKTTLPENHARTVNAHHWGDSCRWPAT